MARDSFEAGRQGGGLRWVLLFIVAVVAAVFLWGAFRRGAAPVIVIDTERPAVGAATRVTAHFKEPARGLGLVRLELIQSDRTLLLGEKQFPRKGAFSLFRGHPTEETEIVASVGRNVQDWLKEGEVVLRASADRMAGPFRSGAPVVIEKRLPVRLRPPRLELVSTQHYLRQGGAGVVVLRAGETARRSGVRAGKLEFTSWPLPGGAARDRFALYAAPWDLDDPGQIKIFAEDDAGNRVELPFITMFKKSPPRVDRIELTDAFLEQVVPAIAAETPGFDTKGTLLDQYLRINGEVRRTNLAEIVALAQQSEPKFLWSGPFLQMPNSARRAGFAETRTYMYQGRPVDRQTHLGLDLASLARSPAPAANSGRVVFAGWLGIYGNAVLLDHGYGLMSLTGHMSAIDVKPGDVVEKGQKLGLTGNTGLAGGDHLHLEIFIQGKSVDPVEWLDDHWIRDNLNTKIPVPI